MKFLKTTIVFFLAILVGNGTLIYFLIAQSPTTHPAETKPALSIPMPSYDDYSYYKRHGRTSKNWNDFVQQGFDAYNRQDCEKTISFLKEAIKAGCQDPIVFFKLGACSEVTGSYYSAAQYYRQAEDGLRTLRSAHRYQIDFYEAYGRTLYLNKRMDEALAYLIKAGDVGTPSFFLFYLTGELLNAKGQNQAAVEYFQKALAQPLNEATPMQIARAYGVIGKSYLEMKDYNKAIEFLTKALENSPNDSVFQQLKYRATEAQRQENLFRIMEGIPFHDQKVKTPTTRPSL